MFNDNQIETINRMNERFKVFGYTLKMTMNNACLTLYTDKGKVAQTYSFSEFEEGYAYFLGYLDGMESFKRG